MADNIKAAEKLGEAFTSRYGVKTGMVKTADIVFDRGLRKACEMNSCGNYGKCHTCPPLCGEPEECEKKVTDRENGIIIQKVYELEDSFDYEGMMAGQRDFSKVFDLCRDCAAGVLENLYALGAGGCRLCEKCAAIDGNKCRHPEKAIISLEASCINVSQLSSLCGMKYINGQNTVTYFGGLFFD